MFLRLWLDCCRWLCKLTSWLSFSEMLFCWPLFSLLELVSLKLCLEVIVLEPFDWAEVMVASLLACPPELDVILGF